MPSWSPSRAYPSSMTPKTRAEGARPCPTISLKRSIIDAVSAWRANAAIMVQNMSGVERSRTLRIQW